MQRGTGRFKNVIWDCTEEELINEWPFFNGQYPYTDLTNNIYGELKVLYRTQNNNSRIAYVCQCKCGKYKKIQANHLIEGSITSCGHKQISKDLTGEKINKLTILGMSELRGTGGEIKWKCLCDCGNICYISTGHLMRKETYSCGCEKSSGEYLIASILRKWNLKYLKQFTFEDCKDKTYLPFDFCIFDKNNNISFLIECDGEQHKKIIDFYGGSNYYEYVQKHDKIKNDYCINNNLKLLRINYDRSVKINDIVKIIKEFIEKNNIRKEDLYES